MLLKANMEITLGDANLIDECLSLHIRSLVYIQNKDKVVDLASEFQKERLKQLIDEIENIRNTNFLHGTELFEEYLKVTETIPDYCHTINGKLDTIKDWFEENVLPLGKVEQLLFLQSELEDIVPYESILTNINGDNI